MDDMDGHEKVIMGRTCSCKEFRTRKEVWQVQMPPLGGCKEASCRLEEGLGVRRAVEDFLRSSVLFTG
jgi:hypothetical protein